MLSRKIVVMSYFFLVPMACLYGFYDVNVVGFLSDIDSLSRHTSSFFDCLGDKVDMRLKLFKTRSGNKQDLSARCSRAFNQGVDVTNRNNVEQYIARAGKLSGMVIFTEAAHPTITPFERFEGLFSPDAIKIASVVYETTEIAPEVVARLNAHCDALIVPDPWLIQTYKNSGVTCPVFALPLVLHLQSLLAQPCKKRVGKPFTFGFSGIFFENGRKNHELLLKAFHAEFGAAEKVKLSVHGRQGPTFSAIAKPFLPCKNISFACKGFTRVTYEEFLASLDCYVTVSKGEGFSIIPREILALGIPCIVANNSAQKTVCASGCVRPITSEIIEPALTEPNLNVEGNWFNTHQIDVQEALRDVYNHYDHYLRLAQKGREWVKQYLSENLTKKYRSLVAPSRVILGNRNEITDDYLMTDSPILFSKYKKLYAGPRTQFHVMDN